MKAKLILSIAAATMMITSCSTQRNSIADLSGKWKIESVNGQKISVAPGQEAPYISLDATNGRIAGYAGCNRLIGSFNPASPDGKIDLSGIGSTRMMCADMSTEQSVLQALGESSAFKCKGSTLALLNNSGREVMRLKKDSSAFSVKSLDGEWSIAELNGNPVVSTDEEAYTMTFNPTSGSFICQTNCNSVGGSYAGKYLDLKMDVSLMTRMSCPDMNVETTLATLLPNVKSCGRLDNGNVALYSADGDALVVLAPIN